MTIHRRGTRLNLPAAWLAGSWLLAVMLQAVISPPQALAGEREAGPPTVTSQHPLPFVADHILPGSQYDVLAVEAGAKSLIKVDASSGSVRGDLQFEGTVQSLAAYQSSNGPKLAVLLRPGAAGEMPFLLQTIEIGGPLDSASRRMSPVPGALKDPAIAFQGVDGASFNAPSNAPVNSPSKSPKSSSKASSRSQVPGEVLVVWDRDPSSAEPVIYRIPSGAEPSRIFTKTNPYALLAVQDDRLMMALNPAEQTASLLNIGEQSYPDTISVPGLESAAPSDLAIFVPDAGFGGTGDVVIANRSRKLLTVLSLERTRLTRLSVPLTIRLDDVEISDGGAARLFVAADRTLSTILVGAEGSDRLGFYRKAGRSLEKLDPIKLPVAIRDIAVLHGPRSSDPEVFAFLGIDGRQLLIVPDMTTLQEDLEPVNELQASGPSAAGSSAPAFTNMPMEGEEYLKLQRVLAVLGFEVGAVDGRPGPRSAAAIRTFQQQSGIDPTGKLDDATLAALNAAVDGIRRNGRAPPAGNGFEAYFADYAAMIGNTVKGFDARRLLALGTAHGDPGNICFGINSLPDRSLWQNSVNIARLVDDLETETGLKLRIVSGYRNSDYNRCIGAPPESPHQTFEAVSLRLADETLPEAELDRLTALLREMKGKGSFAGDVQAHQGAIQIILSGGGIVITADDLFAITKAADEKLLRAIVDHQDILRAAGITDNGYRLSHFIAQVATETAGFRAFEENLNYSAERLLQIYPRYFASLDEAKQYAGDPMKIANRIYAKRAGNGPPESGDGWRYRNRGYIPIFGKTNYKQFGDVLKIDLVGNPDLASDPEVSLRIAAQFWTMFGGNRIADRRNGSEDVADITRKIVGNPMIGLSERQFWFAKTSRVWIGQQKQAN